MKHASKGIKPERDVYLEKLASDLEYASSEIDPYEYMDTCGTYPTEEGFQQSYDLLFTVEGLDIAIEMIEDYAYNSEPFYVDLLARLKARRKEIAPAVSKSKKYKKASRGVRSKNARAGEGVDVEQLARDMDYAYWLTNPYDYGDQFGFYPSEGGLQSSFELLHTVEGVDSGIRFLECDADPNEIPGYDDLLARLKGRRSELQPATSKSLKLRMPQKRPVKSRNEKRFCRVIFDIDDVNLSLDYTDIPTSPDDSLECVLQKYDAKYGTDFYRHIQDDAIAYRMATEEDIHPAFRDAIPVRSWKEAESVAAKARRRK